MKDLDTLLSTVTVHEPNDTLTYTTDDMYAVSNDKGIIAYFKNEADAFRFRLSYINGILNPIEE